MPYVDLDVYEEAVERALKAEAEVKYLRARIDEWRSAQALTRAHARELERALFGIADIALYAAKADEADVPESAVDPLVEVEVITYRDGVGEPS